MRTIVFFLLALFFLSCTEKQNNPVAAELEEGAWSFDTILVKKDLPYYRLYNIGFKLYKDNACDYKHGFYKYVERKERDMEDDYSEYLGMRTKYTLQDDSLKILERNEFPGYKNKWFKFRIVNLTHRFMHLRDSKGNVYRYKKPEKKNPVGDKYDAIIVNSGGCLGSCPINSTMITKDGKLFYNGEHYNRVEGFYTAQIGTEKYTEAENRFRRLDVAKLKKGYHENDASCGSDNNITFIKDGKIAKTITVYTSYSGPIDLNVAFNEVGYLYQKVALKKDNSVGLVTYTSIEPIGKAKRFVLYPSEAYFLAMEINKAKITDNSFVPTHRMNSYMSKTAIETDGRFYKITNNGVENIYDLGYNFLERNAKELRARF